jgi:uncharacterized membrane protein
MKLKALTRAALAAMIVASASVSAQALNEHNINDPRRICEEMAKAADVNKDGMVSQAEFQAMVTSAWKKFDKKNAGQLSISDAARVMLFLSGQGTAP